MIPPVSGLSHNIPISSDQLLVGDEVIVILDDDPAIRESLHTYFSEQGLSVVSIEKAGDLIPVLESKNVALVLLDIGLPDADGTNVLPQITEKFPDVAIVMLSGIADIHVAVDCMRKGADDYLTKPVQFTEILVVVRRILEKRRLVFENRAYQEDLEQAHFRIQFLHQMSLKMNSVYLGAIELDELLRAILVGITAQEGLRFNRAFLVMFDEEKKFLVGRMAIGPDCREEAAHIWTEMQEKQFDLLGIIHNIGDQCSLGDQTVNTVIKSLRVPVTESEHILIRSAMERKSYKVQGGRASVPVSRELVDLLDEDTFVVVPLFAPGHPLGVIIADNYVTRQPIHDSHISVLELFASQASLAIEQSRLRHEMEEKISLLEEVTRELDENKDLLIESECYSALGQMAAQVVHVIRNPITSIGGVARILSKKVDETSEWKRFIDVMVKEADRLEVSLTELFDFVSHTESIKEDLPLNPILRRTLVLLQTNMSRQGIEWEMDLAEPDPVMHMDIGQIQQVFLNLFRNSIEAMANGGKLTITSLVEDGWVRVYVRDTGSGLKGDYWDKAKEPFFTTKTYGTGMGLTMVERYVTLHGGNFSFTQQDVGLEVQVNLPLTQASHEDS
ncbi:MAG: response regulator [Desulfobulbaceae bacterium]|uniref:histidine kinase n=1 Tax=Candidatus Desulfobia pelagia TaxID=2841692 RepID=A0A8J6NDG5_9BACT|nr:response regulator [Candidatus Desulfobia pelagia]